MKSSSKNFNKSYVTLLEDYMMLIPQQIGRKFDPTAIFTSSADIIKQNDVLDSLEVSISSILKSTVPQATVTVDEPQVFKVKVHKIDDREEIERIRKFFKSTSHNNHVSSRYDLKSVYEIEIETMKALFDKKGAPIGNIMELWHGTKASNILSILKSGLMLPNPKSANFTGAMFGLGIYGSDQSTKSLNYACGYWDGKRDNNPYMFLCDFAMGKMFTPTGPTQSLPKPGYNSTYAIGGKSGVANNEMIVYDLAQVNLTRLCEFG
jgi:poly [ADP-ribose] polymerase